MIFAIRLVIVLLVTLAFNVLAYDVAGWSVRDGAFALGVGLIATVGAALARVYTWALVYFFMGLFMFLAPFAAEGQLGAFLSDAFGLEAFARVLNWDGLLYGER